MPVLRAALRGKKRSEAAETAKRDGWAAGMWGLRSQEVVTLLTDEARRLARYRLLNICLMNNVSVFTRSKKKTAVVTHLRRPSHRCRFPVRSWWGGSGTGPGRTEPITVWVGPPRWWAAEIKWWRWTHEFVTEEQLIGGRIKTTLALCRINCLILISFISLLQTTDVNILYFVEKFKKNAIRKIF